MTEKALYLAGPMSGIPKHNMPAFRKAAAELRAAGYKIISPVELDGGAVEAQYENDADGSLNIPGQSWGYFLGRDVKIVADECDGIIFLPGWNKSRGAKLEAYVGVLCDHEFYDYLGDGVIQYLSRNYVKGCL